MILLISCYFNISLVATIPASVILLCLILKPANRFKIVIASLLILIFFFIFYSFNNSTKEMMDSPSLFYLFKDTFTSIKSFKLAINITAKSSTEILVIFFPTLLLLIYLYKKYSSLKNFLFSLVTIVLIEYVLSALVWAIFNVKSDSQQLFYNAGIPIANCFFFVVVIVFISKINHWKYLVYIVIVIWGTTRSEERRVGKEC